MRRTGQAPGQAREWLARLGGRSAMGRGVLTLVGGTGLAQVLAVAASPILSRLYSPADYGVLSVVASTSGLLTFFATVRYELAVPLPAEEGKARALVRLAALLAGLTVGVVAWASWCWRAPLSALFRVPDAVGYWWAIPVAVFGAALYQVGYFWALRTKAYQVLAATRIWQSLSGALISVLLGWSLAGPVGLLIGLVVSQTAGVLRLFRHFAARQPSAEAATEATAATEGLGRVAREYGRFAGLGAAAGFLNASGTLFPPLLITVLYGPGAAGAFGFSLRLISMPMQLVGNAVSQVFLAETAPLIRERPQEVPRVLVRVTRRLAGFAVPVLLGGWLCPLLFPFVFGENWRTAGWLAAFISTYAAAQIVVSPISNIAILLKRQGLQCTLDALRAVATFLSLWLPWRGGMEFLPTAAIFSGVMLLLYGVYFAAYWQLGRQLAAAGRAPSAAPGTPDRMA